MTRAGSGSAKRSDSGQGNIKNFFTKKAEAPESMEVAATGDAAEAKAKSPGHSPGKTSDYESEVGVPENVVWSFDSNFDLCFLLTFPSFCYCRQVAVQRQVAEHHLVKTQRLSRRKPPRGKTQRWLLLSPGLPLALLRLPTQIPLKIQL